MRSPRTISSWLAMTRRSSDRSRRMLCSSRTRALGRRSRRLRHVARRRLRIARKASTGISVADAMKGSFRRRSIASSARSMRTAGALSSSVSGRFIGHGSRGRPAPEGTSTGRSSIHASHRALLRADVNVPPIRKWSVETRRVSAASPLSDRLQAEMRA